MIGMVLATAVLLSPVAQDPNPGEVIPICHLVLGDGSSVGVSGVRCADSTPHNGIRIDGKVIQSCKHKAQTNTAVCFTYQPTSNGPVYTIHAR